MPPSFTRRFGRWLLAFACSLGLATASAQQTFHPEGDVINAMPLEVAKPLKFPIPPRPPGHILDNANFIQPEMRQRLDEAFDNEAATSGAHVFLFTVPSVPRGTFEEITRRVAESWTKGLFGAVMVFDDGSGQLAVQPSTELTKRFYEFELSSLLTEELRTGERPRLSRDALELSAKSLLASLHELKMRANHEDRSSSRTRVGLAIVGLLGLVVGGFALFRRRPVNETDTAVPETTAPPATPPVEKTEEV